MMKPLRYICLGLFIPAISCDRLEVRVSDKDKYSVARFSRHDLTIISTAEEKMIAGHAQFFYSLGCPTISETSEFYVVNFRTCLENTTSWEYTVVVDKKTEKATEIRLNTIS
jgi:hypothetical protein